jgi:transglutaminase-like putative cysteine protease
MVAACGRAGLALWAGLWLAATGVAPCAGQAPAAPSARSAEPAFPIQRHVRYSFTLQNDGAIALERGTLAVYAPVRLTSSQRVDSLATSHPAQVEVDPWGNQVLRFDLGLLPPYASRVVTIDAQLALSNAPQPLAARETELRVFTRAERYIESDDPKIKAIAQGLRAGSALETAQRTYHWVRQTLGRMAFTPEDRGALRALEDKAGDCTEHAYLLAALLRANGVPARVMGGYLMPESGLLRPHDYHNWTEFHHDGAWIVADAHQGNFARGASRYVATRVMSSSVPNPLGATHRYAASGKGLRVSMN